MCLMVHSRNFKKLPKCYIQKYFKMSQGEGKISFLRKCGLHFVLYEDLRHLWKNKTCFSITQLCDKIRAEELNQVWKLITVNRWKNLKTSPCSFSKWEEMTVFPSGNTSKQIKFWLYSYKLALISWYIIEFFLFFFLCNKFQTI